jgi:hypothetical protein
MLARRCLLLGVSVVAVLACATGWGVASYLRLERQHADLAHAASRAAALSRVRLARVDNLLALDAARAGGLAAVEAARAVVRGSLDTAFSGDGQGFADYRRAETALGRTVAALDPRATHAAALQRSTEQLEQALSAYETARGEWQRAAHGVPGSVLVSLVDPALMPRAPAVGAAASVPR